MLLVGSVTGRPEVGSFEGGVLHRAHGRARHQLGAVAAAREVHLKDGGPMVRDIRCQCRKQTDFRHLQPVPCESLDHQASHTRLSRAEWMQLGGGHGAGSSRAEAALVRVPRLDRRSARAQCSSLLFRTVHGNGNKCWMGLS